MVLSAKLLSDNLLAVDDKIKTQIEQDARELWFKCLPRAAPFEQISDGYINLGYNANDIINALNLAVSYIIADAAM